MAYILDITHAHAGRMQVAYVENVTCVTYILHMVAKCELQFCILDSGIWSTHWTTRMRTRVTCVYYILHMVRSRQDRLFDLLTS